VKSASTALVWGVIFGLGIGIAGLARPEVIQGFVDVTGAWNPALMVALVVGAGIYQLGYRAMLRRGRPLLAERLELPTRHRIDRPLLVGAVVFGAGWGIAGMCPGATLVAVPNGDPRSLIFVLAMLGGMALFRARPSARFTPAAETA
jgi:uncharacterized membrane protein YedE/YeeE